MPTAGREPAGAAPAARHALGDPESARRRLREVIDRLPVLPMQDVVRPRTVDAAAAVLLSAGETEFAGIALGAALGAAYPDESLLRESELDSPRAELESSVGADEARRLIDEGRELGVDEMLDRLRAVPAPEPESTD